jgi:hypothetical protein
MVILLGFITIFTFLLLLLNNILTLGIRTLGTGSNTKNRVRQVTTTFSGECAIFILSDRALETASQKPIF